MASKPSSFGNRALSNARRAKNDEFYTQWADIEREMNAYLEYDIDVFRGKRSPKPSSSSAAGKALAALIAMRDCAAVRRARSARDCGATV